jgi:uncharacterized protein YceK
MKKLLIILCVLVLTGCGSATKHYLRNNPDAIPVDFTVHLDRDFVKNISTLGGGQAAMLILVGPFTNNAVLMEAKELMDSGEMVAFQQRIEWGETNFETYLLKNREYQLVVIIQGTRTGDKVIGKIQTGTNPGQHFTVVLQGDGVSIR